MLFKTPEDAFYKEKSTLDILDLVTWKKQNNSYNFKSLPKTAILTHTNIISKRTRLFSKTLKGLTGKNYLLSKSLLMCTGFGNGAPAIVSLMEELRVLGVTDFVFIGFAGRLNNKMTEGESCIVDKAFSTTGCSIFYSAKDNFIPNNNDWFVKLRTQLNLKNVTCWSTDVPFRETPSLINIYREKGADFVDMECAAIYAFSQFYALNAFCVLIAADGLFNNQWIPPKEMKKINAAMLNTLKKLIKFNSND
ncbi:hypothetical protein [uncultured Winogradskyella sp.]|uniref:phosphorylase family protein n=1 Tax=uncultured Winogradskyella sp. TaxID=395353 RepID=UPI002607F338|nr:hypothetical protein [uncultured Winogradskyella sp.]